MANHKITVSIDGETIRCQPDELTMNTKDEVSWTGTGSHPFSIVFDDQSPFEQSELPHAQATSSRKPTRRGYFKYSVVSEQNPNLRLDPIIVVEEPPTDD